MAGPGDETTSPATTPDGDAGPPAPRLLPTMSDEQIRAALKTGYLAIAEDAATEFAHDDAYPTKDLASFKAMLKGIWSTNDESFPAPLRASAGRGHRGRGANAVRLPEQRSEPRNHEILGRTYHGDQCRPSVGSCPAV